MKYETPQMTALTAAINAIQGGAGSLKPDLTQLDGEVLNESIAAYADWE